MILQSASNPETNERTFNYTKKREGRGREGREEGRCAPNSGRAKSLRVGQSVLGCPQKWLQEVAKMYAPGNSVEKPIT